MNYYVCWVEPIIWHPKQISVVECEGTGENYSLPGGKKLGEEDGWDWGSHEGGLKLLRYQKTKKQKTKIQHQINQQQKLYQRKWREVKLRVDPPTFMYIIEETSMQLTISKDTSWYVVLVTRRANLGVEMNQWAPHGSLQFWISETFYVKRKSSMDQT